MHAGAPTARPAGSALVAPSPPLNLASGKATRCTLTLPKKAPNNVVRLPKGGRALAAPLKIVAWTAAGGLTVGPPGGFYVRRALPAGYSLQNITAAESERWASALATARPIADASITIRVRLCARTVCIHVFSYMPCHTSVRVLLARLAQVTRAQVWRSVGNRFFPSCLSSCTLAARA